jgi:hypothetical protein
MIPAQADKPIFDVGLYGAENRAKVIRYMDGFNGVCLVVGAKLLNRKWTDTEIPFRQESNFFYLTAIASAGYSLVIDLDSSILLLLKSRIVRYIYASFR